MKRYCGIFSGIIFLVFIASSCKKESATHCWVIVDNLGNDLSHVCNKTETELVDCVNHKTCGVDVGFTINSCNYYIEDAEKFCYLISGEYRENINESWASLIKNCYGIAIEKVNCGYCKRWFNREKRIYKPANTTFYSAIKSSFYCGDTLTSIYQGRQIIRKDDADSLITIQFSNNGTDW